MRYKSLASIRIKVILDKSEFSNVEIVRRIREKIETDTSAPKILITKRGVGYYIATKK